MNPYTHLPEKAFWKTAIANKDLLEISGLWAPKFNLTRGHKVVTFGSCFAQHIGAALLKRGYSWLSTEPEPFGLSPENCRRFNYNVFSCRTGNIYSASLLGQWVEWALQIKAAPNDYWEQDARFFDPFRPAIEPNGFGSKDEMLLSRQRTITCFNGCIKQADVFIFTLGLTESWFNQQFTYEYPMCPGTVAGSFDPMQHVFINQKFDFIKRNLEEAILMMREANKNLRFILTVSPVPLTATNSGKHVLVATMESKSILRAVAGELAGNFEFVDYFPAYEIINGTPFKGVFFEANQRTVSQQGVDFVMALFFQGLLDNFGDCGVNTMAPNEDKPIPDDEVVCEEMILGAFSPAALP